jgi:hypothetical protein
MVMLYHELDEHAGNCLHHPCYCPYSNCQFIGPTESTCNHIRDVHKESIINFNYGRQIEVVLPRGRSCEFNFKVIAEVDCLFLLQRRETEDTLLRQSALSVFCLRASDPSEKPQFLFELKTDLVGSPVGAFIALGYWVEHSLCDAELNHSDASLHVPSRFCAPNGDIHVSVKIKKPTIMSQSSLCDVM